MGFVRDNVEFTMDNIDTEVESITVSDESSVILIFGQSGHVFFYFD